MCACRGHLCLDVAALIVRQLHLVALCVTASDDEVVDRARGGIAGVRETAVAAIDGVQYRRILQLREEAHIDDVFEADGEKPLVECRLEDGVMTGEIVEAVVEILIVREDDDTDARIIEAHDGIHALHERRVRVGVHVNVCADAVLSAVRGLTDDLDVLNVALRVGEDLIHLHGGVRDNGVRVDIHPRNLLHGGACSIAHGGVAVDTHAIDRDGLGERSLCDCHAEEKRDENFLHNDKTLLSFLCSKKCACFLHSHHTINFPARIGGRSNITSSCPARRDRGSRRSARSR